MRWVVAGGWLALSVVGVGHAVCPDEFTGRVEIHVVDREDGIGGVERRRIAEEAK